MRLFIILIVLLSFKTLSAQDISKQKWKHRVLLIFTSEENAEDYKIQLSFLKNSDEGFKERQLIIYEVLPNQYKSRLHKTKSNWKKEKQLYKKHMNFEDKFKVVLIRLDGKIKKIKNTPLTKQQLFGIIDAMPMRQSETQKN